jgi:hypothetical protein
MSVRKDWMKILYLLVAVLLGSSLVFGQESSKTMPRIVSVAPASGQVGAELIASGENLDQDNVAELRLTDGTNDFKVPITSQTATAIKFKIPNEIKPGRYGLVTFSKRVPRSLEVEQPVKITVEEQGPAL